MIETFPPSANGTLGLPKVIGLRGESLKTKNEDLPAEIVCRQFISSVKLLIG